jgi:PKD repeat protein
VANPTGITYNTAGTYDVKLVVTNAYGSDSMTRAGYIKVNTVNQKPVANFSASVTTVTAGGFVTFSDASSNTPTSWKWTFEGGTPNTANTSTKLVQYNTAGSYYVKLVVSNAFGSDSTTKSAYITVNSAGQKPVADFSANKTLLKAGDSVTFTDLSTNSPIGLVWSFQGGTPSTSTATSPLIKYKTPGLYNVQLIAINAAGSDTMIKTGYIKVDPQGINEAQNASVRIYPSPVKDKLYIESDPDAKISSVEIFDFTGKLRYSGNNSVKGTSVSLDLSSLPKGLYLLRISGKNLNYSGTISKE